MGAKLVEVPACHQSMEITWFRKAFSAEGKHGVERTVFRPGPDEAYRSGYDAGDQQLVIEDRWPPLFVRIDFYVLLPQAFSAVVCTVAKLPIRLARLGELPVSMLFPGRSGRLYLAEVWGGIALDVLFTVETLFVSSRVLGSLLRIGEIGWHTRRCVMERAQLGQSKWNLGIVQ